MIWLTLLSALAVVAFAGVLVVYLVMIQRTLDAIGGKPTSYLAKIRMGVRAIESETAMLAPQVTRLNEGATAILGGFKAVAADLDSAVKALGGRS
ncbi:MAG: hypothetical protein ACT4P5_20415 [Armatimonadota bacterium]